MLKSNLCDYSVAYIHVKGKRTIAIAGEDAAARQADESNKVIMSHLPIVLLRSTTLK